MMRSVSIYLALSLFVCFANSSAGLARGNDWTVTDGSGEQVKIKHGFWGRTDSEVKDRLGDKFVQKKGLFGSKETEVNVLGNQFARKRGWLGGSDIKGQDILGDSVTTKKGFFGRRTTTVNLSGASNALQALFSPKKLPGSPSQTLDNRINAPADPLTPLGDPNLQGDIGSPVKH